MKTACDQVGTKPVWSALFSIPFPSAMTPPLHKLPSASTSGCRVPGIFLALLFLIASASADTLQWDATPGAGGAAGVQLGNGNWANLAVNWRNTTTGTDDVTWDNARNDIAEFGISGALITASSISVTDTVIAGGLGFLGFSASPAAIGYNFTNGTIQLATGASINIADNASSGNGFITINSTLAGQNLIIQKSGGTGIGFVSLGGNNIGLTGTLTLAGANGGTFLRPTAVTAVNSLTSIIVESGSTFASTVSGTFTANFVISGQGKEQNAGTGDFRGAIRVDASSSQVFSGNITIAGTAATFNTSGGTAAITGNIGESSALSVFTKKGDGTLTLSGTNTYTKGTSVTGGTLELSFATASATSNIIAGGTAFSLTGSSLLVTGKASSPNSQTFGTTSVKGVSSIAANAGSGGTLSLHLGTISREGTGDHLRITANTGTTILASHNGLIGAWAIYQKDGVAGWAGASGGVVGIFSGDLEYATGTNVSDLPGYSTGSNLSITGASEGNVTVTAGTTQLNTITMVGKCDSRSIAIGAGNLIRFGAAGGIQILSEAKSLTVGATPGAGQITAGTTGSTELILTNNSASSTLLINAQIIDNGGSGGSTDVSINGTGNTVLATANTYTGLTQVLSGSVEAAHNQALGAVGSGTTSRTVVSSGAALEVSGNLSNMAENLLLNGSGISSGGALRNVSGTNTLSGTITLGAATRISSDAGTLILSKGAAATTIITLAQNLTFAGNGNIEVQSRIANGTGTITKTGNGMLILSGNNNFTTSISITGGTLRFNNVNALGTVAGGVTVSGGTLDITNNTTTLAETLSLSGAGLGNQGALLSSSG
ncbi:MAG: beta strand repeat-containing protein, partial [Verrucomicrobium sp.]